MAKKGKSKTVAGISDFSVLLSPVITEKSSVFQEQGSRVVFRVCPKASKEEIKQAVERVFNVNVDSVRTCNYLGKVKRTNKSIGRRSSYKKAYVTLEVGQSIDIVEGL